MTIALTLIFWRMALSVHYKIMSKQMSARGLMSTKMGGLMSVGPGPRGGAGAGGGTNKNNRYRGGQMSAISIMFLRCEFNVFRSLDS